MPESLTPTLSTTPPPSLPPLPPRPAEPDAAAAPPPAPDAPPAKPSKRPTTRAGREALKRQRQAQRQAGKPEAAPKSTAKATPRRASLESRLASSLSSVGTGILVAGAASGSAAVQADGLLVVEHAPNIAKALDSLAKDNPAVAASLERMLTAGAWSGVIAATVPVAIGVCANHGLIPPALAAAMGGQAPEPAGAGG